MEVTFQARPPHESLQVGVSHGKLPGISPTIVVAAVVVVDELRTAQVECDLTVCLWLPVMATNAVSVDHRLHFPLEAESARRAEPRCDLAGLVDLG